MAQRFAMNVVPENGDRNKRSRKTEKDDFDTEYDSTWVDDDGLDDGKRVSMRWRHGPNRNMRAAKDMQHFRHLLKQVEKQRGFSEWRVFPRTFHNLLFYQNKMPSRPDGVYIRQFFEEWFGDYGRLEQVHSYIQWLFPIQERGLNNDAQILHLEEIKHFREDKEAMRNLVLSYRLMLDFYGIELLDESTGRLRRATNWRQRFDNLDRNTHNNLRITRILKCLGILGFKHFQAPLVQFFLHETLVKGELPRVKYSVLDYFMFSVLDKTERKKLIRFAFQNFEPKDEFVWCPRRIQRKFLMESKPQTTENSDSNNSEAGSDAETTKKCNQTKRTDQVFSYL